ncbi:hypothetical protein NLJ89_g9517 [Agrocybe chaxingu]|uniref:Uncharacterized protein n=1 Tax=Agrocybe chaxingu TaxID=84603 RepID=A0A9W8MT12_9AGAR|nr:hypothetical protein NLJ89_g9517 [Agrocybe chaxingu]
MRRSDLPILTVTPFKFVNASALIQTQFTSHTSLITWSSIAPTFGREMRNLAMSLDDLGILLKQSTAPNAAALVFQLTRIQFASKEVGRDFQLFNSRLIASSNVLFNLPVSVLASSERAIAASSLSPLSPQWTAGTGTRFREAYLHTLQTLENFNRELTYLNEFTHTSIMALERGLEILVALAHDETHKAPQQEAGEILCQLWMNLADTQDLVSDPQEPIEVLGRIQPTIKYIKTLVFEVQERLEVLQIDIDLLREQVVEQMAMSTEFLESVNNALHPASRAVSNKISIDPGNSFGVRLNDLVMEVVEVVVSDLRKGSAYMPQNLDRVMSAKAVNDIAKKVQEYRSKVLREFALLQQLAEQQAEVLELLESISRRLSVEMHEVSDRAPASSNTH